MILVDTSVWCDHLSCGDPALIVLLEAGAVLTHPVIVSELALLGLRQRQGIIDALQGLPTAHFATQDQILETIRQFALTGLGLTVADVQVLTATRLTTDVALWTRSPLLREVATQVGRAFTPLAQDHGALRASRSLI